MLTRNTWGAKNVLVYQMSDVLASVPSTTFGYHIRDIKLNYIGENKDLVHFVILLALGGDISNAI